MAKKAAVLPTIQEIDGEIVALRNEGQAIQQRLGVLELEAAKNWDGDSGQFATEHAQLSLKLKALPIRQAELDVQRQAAVQREELGKFETAFCTFILSRMALIGLRNEVKELEATLREKQEAAKRAEYQDRANDSAQDRLYDQLRDLGVPAADLEAIRAKVHAKLVPPGFSTA